MKKLNISRLVCLLLVALMLLPIAACGNPQDDDTSKPDETTPAADVGATRGGADLWLQSGSHDRAVPEIPPAFGRHGHGGIGLPTGRKPE